MQSQINLVKPEIRNVVTTSTLNQPVNIQKFVQYGWGIYDSEIYHGRCGYVKSPEMRGRVTIFSNGKMISIGSTSITASIKQLNQAKFYLLRAGLISDVKLKPIVRNIVATITLGNRISINKIFPKMNNAIYEPDQFPAMIIKSIKSASYLVFSSGKIVITGMKSEDEVSQSAYEIQQRLAILQK